MARRYSCILVYALCALFSFCGCAAQGGGESSQIKTESGNQIVGGKANAFNPYMQKQLPNTRGLSSEGEAMGGRAVAIESEAAHRTHWKEELYPVVFGRPDAPHEVLVMLDFAKPQSQAVWKEVIQATRAMSPEASKVVLFSKNSENYGTDLMGLAIWHTWSRKGQVIPFMDYALHEWQQAKTMQRKTGKVNKFNNEYDSAVAGGYPIHYNWLMRLTPPVSPDQELQVARYSYDAGNVNMYQTVQVMRYYGISKLPAVLIDGTPLNKISTEAIRGALSK